MHAANTVERSERPAAASLLRLCLIFVLAAGCSPAFDLDRIDLGGPTDADATAETAALFTNLRALSPDSVLFGHQDALAYGVEWFDEPGRSDVRDVAGSHPAVVGWDLGNLERDSDENLDGVSFVRMRELMIEAYERGAVNTASWHSTNLFSGGDVNDTTVAVPHLLPGGSHHYALLAALDRLADFFQALRTENGELVPVIFRPFHEVSGNWFWWSHSTPEEFAELWQFSVSYLREQRGVHNLLWCFSTDIFDSEAEYAEYYPGDEWVDVVGFDDYRSIKRPVRLNVFARRLRRVVEFAEAGGKIPALTETGIEGVGVDNWWTETLLEGIRRDEVGSRIAWVLVWRNANRELDRPDHFYAPYPEHPSAADFRAFRADPLILFEDDLPSLYSD